ncbi:hypothetical protein [Planctomicrobium sp. SH664]|uniref:hypothetical protein n=1 Tax=Planctomicrobium sp. SH664 TaxID=3448125 RepID=UPI003F5CBB4E
MGHVDQQGSAVSHPRPTVTCLDRLTADNADPRGEIPLFAAGLEFAQETAGPLTRLFLQALPPEWTSVPLVIDSTLVWLGRGFRQGLLHWFHEPFPGRTDGIAGATNCRREAEHLACCWGGEGLTFLSGVAAESELSDRPCSLTEIAQRHERLQTLLREGRLHELKVPAATLYQYGWGAFHRFRPATTSGFQFWIRATRHDPRPLVNGIRNATNL